MTIRHVVVAVPVRDEEEMLGDCLTAIAAAARHLHRTHPKIGCEVVVTLDGCSDGSADVAAAHPVTVVHGPAEGVGRARDIAIQAGLTRSVATGTGLAATWIACTDADSRPPVHWLTRGVELAHTGADLVLGTVHPRDAEPAVLTAWRARHDLGEGHRHVHGANLGARASGYVRLGGFGSLRLHEDVDLVVRARAAGLNCVATDTLRVATSARERGRLDGGSPAIWPG